MKKVTLKALSKSARTSAQKNLESNLVTVLQSTLAGQNQDSKKLKKQIEKGSKKLAKKLSKKFKYSKERLLALNNEIEVTAISGPSKSDTQDLRAANRKPRLRPVTTPNAVSTKASVNESVQTSADSIQSNPEKINPVPVPRTTQKRPVKKISTTTPVVKKTFANIEEQTKPVLPE